MSDPWKEVRGDVRYNVAEIAAWQNERLASMRQSPECWTATERSFASQIDFLLRTNIVTSTKESAVEKVLIPAKTIVHINGIPVALAADTLVEMAAANIPLITSDTPAPVNVAAE